jgi:LEA14-like dessication related protein
MKKLIFVLVALFLGCASLSQLIQKPTVRLDKMNLKNFSFQDVTLDFDFAVTNPNPFGVSVAGFDYNFAIQEQNFLTSEQAQQVQILANQTSKVTIPITVKFKELYQMFQTMQDQDEVNYGLNGHVHVKGPWDVIKIPFSTKGKIPAVKLPKISLEGVKINSLSFSGVKMNLKIGVDNPNIFGFSLNNFDYKVALAGKDLASGNNSSPTSILQKGKSTLDFPISLDFAAVGNLLMTALQKGEIDYNLIGTAGLNTDYGAAQVPFNKTGQTKIWK